MLGSAIAAIGLLIGVVFLVAPGSEEFDTSLIGADFTDRHCMDGEVLRATMDNPKFLLRIIGSTRCGTAWATIEWSGSLEQVPDRIEASIYPCGSDPAGPKAQVVQKSDIRSASTRMIERGSRGSVCALGVVVVGGQRSAPVELYA
ncbi:hypothetical protein [Nocardia sp. BMG111209]|uniref:hypothetical protein n=1 Tax=Nocardia sp. BMG111209 TaxID=1160137 RepID=UPI000369D443|nr:hypothetical protein [Nocardia sp. BMG111209]